MAKNYILGIILSRVLALLLFKGFLFSPFYTLPNTHIDGGRELRLGRGMVATRQGTEGKARDRVGIPVSN